MDADTAIADVCEVRLNNRNTKMLTRLKVLLQWPVFPGRPASAVPDNDAIALLRKVKH